MKEAKQAIKSYFKNFANYRGITGKTEYFFSICFGLAMLGTAELLMAMVGAEAAVFFAVDTLLLIPMLTLCARRLNDAGKNWIFAFTIMLPSPFNLILIGYLLVLKGKKAEHYSTSFNYATYGMLAMYGLVRILKYMFML